MDAAYDRTFNPPAPVIELKVSSVDGRLATRSKALLDTGADRSVVPSALVQRLRLQRTGTVLVRGMRGHFESVPLFSVRLELAEDGALFDVISWDNDFVILGRDVLNRWRIMLGGPAGKLSITRPAA